jgi:ribosomal protein S12 methylthiotransferase
MGRTLQVLLEEGRDGWVAGRSHRDAPEIDGWVYVQGDHAPGSLLDVEVTDFAEYDLYGVVRGEKAPTRRLVTPLRMSGPKSPQ